MIYGGGRTLRKLELVIPTKARKDKWDNPQARTRAESRGRPHNVAGIWGFEMRNLLRRVSRALVYAFAGLGLLVFVVSTTPLVDWSGALLAGPWNDPRGDILIVLGAGAGDFGVMGSSSYLRAQYAVAAYHEGGFRTIVLSGGGKPIPVAAEMRALLISAGIIPTAILTETSSTSTRENALFTKNLVAALPGKKVLLTSDYHMFRAYRTFRKVGLNVLPRPIPDARKRAVSFRTRWPAFTDVGIELVKIAYYYARGWI
jgi:uncharacterized SAM-binding protein YcdF (DUF218 family)